MELRKDTSTSIGDLARVLCMGKIGMYDYSNGIESPVYNYERTSIDNMFFANSAKQLFVSQNICPMILL